jgi:hypothetical protein
MLRVIQGQHQGFFGKNFRMAEEDYRLGGSCDRGWVLLNTADFFQSCVRAMVEYVQHAPSVRWLIVQWTSGDPW